MRKRGCLAVPLVLVLGLAAAVAMGGACPPARPGPAALPAAPVGVEVWLPSERRAEESTFLTFPEWSIVYSAQEQAAWLASERPSRFPYFRSIGLYWCGYAAVYELTRERYPFNAGNHLMLGVIGVSFTAEYALKGAYEATVGRVSEAIAGGATTEEDRFAERVAVEYASFLDHTPWYDFPFAARAAALWREVPVSGAHPIRKWERRLALTVDLGGRAAYGWLIGRASASVYAPEESLTFVLAEAGGAPPGDPRVRLVRSVEPGLEMLALPRYARFTEVGRALLRAGLRPVQIAGNGRVFLTAIAPRGWRYDLSEGTAAFEQEIATDPAHKRVAVEAPVVALPAVVDGLERAGARVEHIYDY